MSVEVNDRDPEILELSREIHELTGQIKSLVAEINKASVLLVARVEKTTVESSVLLVAGDETTTDKEIKS